MAVSLSSDLIADVMRNANPARLQSATAALQALQSPEGDLRAFEDMLDHTESIFPNTGVSASTRSPGTAESPEPYVEFERMVLRNLFESLLPSPQSGAFGTGPSAGVWRSLAADQLAGVYAGAGGVGIASTLAGNEGSVKEAAQWPYFSTEKIEAFTG